MDYKKIDVHMKNKFSSKDKIKEIKNLNNSEISKISDSEIYKVELGVIAIDIIESVKLNEKLKVDNYNAIISEFAFGASSILKAHGGIWIRIQGDMVYAIFKPDKNKNIDSIFDAACELNTFMEHLNKNIFKSFNRKNLVNAGIGIWLSSENYITMVGKNNDRDIVFMGDSVNKACKLANLAGRDKYTNILFNNSLEIRFTKETKILNNKLGGFRSYKIPGISERILGCDWNIDSYTNFINNNV